MISLDDPRWVGLKGGRRVPCDPRPSIRAISAGAHLEDAWSQLWDDVYHQGDIGEAAYASVVVLSGLNQQRRLGWNVYNLAAMVEIDRHRPGNPPIPDWLAREYGDAGSSLALQAYEDLRTETDPTAVRCQVAIILLARGLRKHGNLVLDYEESDLDELIEARNAWIDVHGYQELDARLAKRKSESGSADSSQ